MNISLKQAQIHENEHGKWIQCLIKTVHEKNITKHHVVERKLGLNTSTLSAGLGKDSSIIDSISSGIGVRTWYFTRFEN
jgi:hypothetical protein